MRRFPILLLGVLLLPVPPAPARSEDESGGAEIHGTVTRHGFPARATVKLARTGEPEPPRREPRSSGFFGVLARPPGGGDPVAVAETDEDGAFRFAGLPAGEYRLLATAGDEWALRRDLFAEEGEGPGTTRTRVDLRLVAGEIGECRGRAVWSDGSPCRGVVVLGPADAETDAEGNFALRGAIAGEEVLSLWAEGKLLRTRPRPASGRDGEVRLVVDEGLEPLAGRVLSGGRPLAGAEVAAVTPEPEGGLTATGAVTDETGRFSVPGRSGSEVQVRRAGLLAFAGKHPGPGTDLSVELLPAPVIEGRVVSAIDGRPQPGAPVHLLELVHEVIETGRFAQAGVASTVSGPDGRFTLVSPFAGDAMLFVFGRGFVTPGLEEATGNGYNPAALRLVPGERVERTLPAAPSPCVAGRVTGPGGRGVAAATVRADDEFPAWEPWQWRMGWFGSLATTTTGPDGRYRIPTLLPGSVVTVLAEPPDRPGAKAGPRRIGTDGATRVDLALPTPAPDRYVVVTVTTAADGRPVAGARVSASREIDDGTPEWARPGIGDELATEETGADGRARLGPFTPGPVLVSVRHGDFAPSDEVEVDVAAAAPAATFALAEGLTIEGRVLRPDGTPLQGARVSVNLPGSWSEDAGSGRTDGEGRFRIGGLRAGPYAIGASARAADGGFLHGLASVEAGDHDVVLRVVVEGGGRVHAPRPPRPTSGRSVELRLLGPGDEPVASATLGVRAWREFSFGPGGTLSREVRLPVVDGAETLFFGAGEKALWVEVRPAPETGLGPALAGPLSPGDEPFTVRLSPTTRIAGTVLGPDGKGVPGTRVTAIPANAGLLDRHEHPGAHGAAWADAAGRFSIPGLGSGTYLLLLDSPPDRRPEGPVFAPGGDEDVAIELLPAAAVEIVVFDRQGAPLPGAMVALYDPGVERPPFPRKAPWCAETDSTGRARLTGLPRESTWVLWIEPPYEREDLGAREVDEWTPADGTFRLGSGRRVRLRVVDPDGFPFPLPEVKWSKDDGTEEELRGDTGGRLEIRDAPQEKVRLLVAPGGTNREEPGWTEVVLLATKEAEEVEVVLDAGSCVTVRVEGWPEDAVADVHWYAGGDGWESDSRLPMPSDGRARLHDCLPGGKYAFHVALPDGRMAYAEDLLPWLDDTVLELRPGMTVTGRVDLPPGASRVRLDLQGPRLDDPRLGFEVPVAADGEFRIAGLPKGEYSLDAHAEAAGKKYAGEGRFHEAGRIEIRLRPVR